MKETITLRIGLGEVRSNHGTSNGKPALILEPISPSGPVGHRAPGTNEDQVTDGSVILEIHAPEGVAIILDDLKKAMAKDGMTIPPDVFSGL